MYLFNRLRIRFLLMLVAQTGCYGQLPDFNVQLLNDKNGIQTSNASRIIRDRTGFLWILSPRHLQRFDGQSVRRVDTAGEDLLDMASDGSGTLWVVSEKEIKRYRNDHRGLLKVKTDGPRLEPLNKLNKLQITPDDAIWANAGRGLYRYDGRTDSFRFHQLPGLQDHYYYRRIFNSRGYQLYLADIRTVFCYDTRKKIVRSVPFESARAVVPVNDDIAWVSTSLHHTFEINFADGSVRRIPLLDTAHPLGIPLAELISFTALGAGKGLVNTTKGCYLYHEKDRTFSRAVIFDSGKSLPNDENYSDFRDPDGTHWILSQDGILFFRPEAHTIGWINGFAGNQQSPANNIKALAEDSQGNIWLGTSGGISVLDVRTGQTAAVHDKQSGAFTSEVRGLLFDGKNLIVAPSRALPMVLDPVSRAFTDVIYPEGAIGRRLRARLRDDLIATIVRMPDGNFLVVGESVCYRIEKGSYRIREVYFRGVERIVQTVAQDARGNYWMGTYQGLLVVDDQFTNAVSDSGFSPGNLVSAVLIRNDSTAWCGSVGLYEVTKKGKELKKKLIFPELRNQRIAMIRQDRSGRVWIGSDDGLYLLNREADKLQWFDFRDNIQNRRFNYNSVLESADGNIYIGGLSGLNYFDPDKLKFREERLNVVITSVRVNQDDSIPIGNTPPLQLNWKQNSIEIQFLTPYYRNPQKLMYRYRLAGLDDNWVDNGRSNRVRFSSLSGGSYAFTVGASLDGVTWWETAAPFAFTILSPWWEQWWFAVLCVFGTGGALYGLFRWRVTRIRRQTTLREHMAELEMRALRAQMNPHFIFNCLNSINRYIVKSDNATASLYLTRFAKLIRLILDNSNSKKVLLSNELEALKLYIEMERIRFDNQFEYRIEVGEEVNPDSVQVPSLIIQPYVENAIWHGLLHMENSGNLWIRLRMIDESVLECVVEDNGIGREKAGEYRSKSATGRKSLGMKLTEDRIAVLNQYAQTNARVEILDLKNETGEPSGTRVTITIPV